MNNSFFFTKVIWNLQVRKVQESINTVVTILYRPEVMVRDDIKELGSLIEIEMVVSQNNRGHIEVLNHQTQSRMCNYCNEWH